MVVAEKTVERRHPSVVKQSISRYIFTYAGRSIS